MPGSMARDKKVLRNFVIMIFNSLKFSCARGTLVNRSFSPMIFFNCSIFIPENYQPPCYREDLLALPDSIWVSLANAK